PAPAGQPRRRSRSPAGAEQPPASSRSRRAVEPHRPDDVLIRQGSKSPETPGSSLWAEGFRRHFPPPSPPLHRPLEIPRPSSPGVPEIRFPLGNAVARPLPCTTIDRADDSSGSGRDKRGNSAKNNEVANENYAQPALRPGSPG